MGDKVRLESFDLTQTHLAHFSNTQQTLNKASRNVSEVQTGKGRGGKGNNQQSNITKRIHAGRYTPQGWSDLSFAEREECANKTPPREVAAMAIAISLRVRSRSSKRRMPSCVRLPLPLVQPMMMTTTTAETKMSKLLKHKQQGINSVPVLMEKARGRNDSLLVVKVRQERQKWLLGLSKPTVASWT
jgi:hypothetical protein